MIRGKLFKMPEVNIIFSVEGSGHIQKYILTERSCQSITLNARNKNYNFISLESSTFFLGLIFIAGQTKRPGNGFGNGSDTRRNAKRIKSSRGRAFDFD
jgi:hypothetical protein